MNEFPQATLLCHVFQKRDSYVNLCKFGAAERDAFVRFYIPKQIFLQFAFANFIIACPTSWVILKQLNPSPSRATGLIVKYS